MNDRIQYIDRLKGLAILLVVIGHLMAFCTHGERNPIYEVICSFHMPLFMFLSGLVLTYTPPLYCKIFGEEGFTLSAAHAMDRFAFYLYQW